MQEAQIKLSGEYTEVEQENVYEDNSGLILEYTKKFIKDDLMNVTHYCLSWSGQNGKSFKSKQPEDLIFHVLEKINEGKWKCYTKTYKHFRNSVYYHVRNELLDLFKNKKKGVLTEDAYENVLTQTEAEQFFDEGLYADGAEDVLCTLEKGDLREYILNLFDPNEEIEEIAVLEEIFEDKKRDDIAESLGITVNEVTNIQKRIIRRLRKHKIKNLLEGDI